MLPLIFLTAGSCDKFLPSMPRPPADSKYQIIVDHNQCDDNNECQIVSYCAEYKINSKNEYQKVAEHPLKTCHGFFAFTPDTEKRMMAFFRDLLGWSKTHCSE